jgi:hypothetical protein
MGLDQYAFTTKTSLTSAVDIHEPSDAEELHYWRKHPNLHGWMEALYFRKGGQNEDFNLAGLRLDSADIDQLEIDVKAHRLPVTTGFFFGESDGSEIEDDLLFVAEARAAIADGKAVYYVAFW